MLMHSRVLVYSYDALWRRWTVSKRAVRSDGIVELQLGEASVLCLPVSLVCHPFVGPPVIGIYISQWV